VAALEACLVVRDAVGGEEVDEVDRLVAGFALVLRAGERHGGDRAPRLLHLPRRHVRLASRSSCSRPAGNNRSIDEQTGAGRRRGTLASLAIRGPVRNKAEVDVSGSETDAL